MSKGILAALIVVSSAFAAGAGSAPLLAQESISNHQQSAVPCVERPTGNGMQLKCPVPAFLPDSDLDDVDDDASPSVRISLRLPEGTPIRIVIDRRTPIAHAGEAVRGHVAETVYAFDEPVIPAGTVALGWVTHVVPVPKLRRIESYANGNFSPFHQYQVMFDRLVLPDGRELAIRTTVSAGSVDVVHLMSKPSKVDEEKIEKEKSGAARVAGAAKQGMKDTVQEANDSVHQAAEQIRAPGKWQRIKKYMAAQSPYRKQYVEVGTHFSASLKEDLDFGSETHSPEHLAQLGGMPVANSILHARLILEVSSATATRGAPVVAELTEPVYSAHHELLLPSGSRLIGVVLEAKPARHPHRNGELRVIFEHIEVPGGGLQELQGTLEGIQVDRSAHMKLDEEGGARGTDSKTRYLSTGVALLMVAAAAHPDIEHDTVDPAGDPAVRAGAGASGFGLAGTVIGLAAKSNVVSIVFSAYGAATSIYTNFLSRGHDVVLPKDAPLEIGLGIPHPKKN